MPVAVTENVLVLPSSGVAFAGWFVIDTMFPEGMVVVVVVDEVVLPGTDVLVVDVLAAGITMMVVVAVVV